MILYGSGDPIDALQKLAPYVVSVHAKDGDWPPADKPGALGTERPLGQGAVGMPRFVDALKRVGYKGSINVEREIEDQAQRLVDIAMGSAAAAGVGSLSGPVGSQDAEEICQLFQMAEGFLNYRVVASA